MARSGWCGAATSRQPSRGAVVWMVFVLTACYFWGGSGCAIRSEADPDRTPHETSAQAPPIPYLQLAGSGTGNPVVCWFTPEPTTSRVEYWLT
ncbi:MAG: hypothetical protein ABIF77_19575 [bacterium]